MTYRVIILPQAHADIDRNADWWAHHHSLEQAQRWCEAIYNQLESLRQFPASYSRSPENNDFPVELRDKRIGLGSRPDYRAVFTIQDQTVTVLAVLRLSQDRLRPDESDIRLDA